MEFSDIVRVLGVEIGLRLGLSRFGGKFNIFDKFDGLNPFGKLGRFNWLAAFDTLDKLNSFGKFDKFKSEATAGMLAAETAGLAMVVGRVVSGTIGIEETDFLFGTFTTDGILISMLIGSSVLYLG